MSKAKRKAIIIAVICIILGILLHLWVYYHINGDYRKLNTANFETKTYEITEEFRSLDINDMDCDVNIVLLEDNGSNLTCRVETTESELYTSTVKVEDGTLKITREDNRRWFDNIGIFWYGETATTVFLPNVWFDSIDDSYDNLTVNSVSGNISVQRDFNFKNVDIYSVSGDVDFNASVSRDWEISTTSGEIDVKSTGGWHGNIETVSGDVKVANVGVDVLYVATTSGEVRLEKTSTGQTTISTVSGDVELLHPDLREFNIITVSGDVEGDIGGSRNYEISTVSGDVNVPESYTDGDPCRISTTSGDIDIK